MNKPSPGAQTQPDVGSESLCDTGWLQVCIVGVVGGINVRFSGRTLQWHEAAHHTGPRGHSQLHDWQPFPAGRVMEAHVEPLGMAALREWHMKCFERRSVWVSSHSQGKYLHNATSAFITVMSGIHATMEPRGK